jgi:two-component system nitrogen regulation response regulator GlnG
MQDTNTTTHNHATLPCLDLPELSATPSEDLVLTVIFHPDTRRIGARVTLPSRLPAQGWLLGRHEPDFAGRDGAGQPLRDPHVSRQALCFRRAGGRLVIERCPGSSRASLAGDELRGTRSFERQALRAGVPVLFAHSVLLLLHLAPRCAPGRQAGEDILIGGSSRMRRLREQLARAAGSDLDVLLLGESGTGKELAARVLHRDSRRSGGPLVPVNMAAVNPELAAAALFGAARGAFTGAEREQEGYFQRAEGGSLFLDEIGDTCQSVQPQLLRALQEREIQRVGGRTCKVDVRVISATDARIDEHGCSFRSALRHRLGACEITLPPLRERREDIGELLLHFLGEAARYEGRQGILPRRDSSSVHIAAWVRIFLRCLVYDWPGNVRQLANVARQVVLASAQGPEMPGELVRRMSPLVPSHSVAEQRPGRQRRMAEVSDAEFDDAMHAEAFEPQRVARALEVSRSSVYRRIERSAYRLAHQVPERELSQTLALCRDDVAAAALRLQVSASSLRARLGRRACREH